MLITNYDPSATAHCPVCKTSVKCQNTGGILDNCIRRYLDFYHDNCGTRWRNYIDAGDVKILSEAKDYKHFDITVDDNNQKQKPSREAG